MEKRIRNKTEEKVYYFLSNIKMVDIVFGLPNETGARGHLYADGEGGGVR